MQYLAVGIRCLIGTVFLVSSVSKVAERGAFGGFVASVRDMRLLPAGLVRPTALFVVAAELGVWVMLATPMQAVAVGGFTVAAGLLAIFAVSIALVLRRGARTPCRCFGKSTIPLGPRHVARNVALVVVAALGGIAERGGGAVHPGGLVMALFCGILLGGLVIVLDDILEVFRPVDLDRDLDSRVR